MNSWRDRPATLMLLGLVCFGASAWVWLLMIGPGSATLAYEAGAGYQTGDAIVVATGIDHSYRTGIDTWYVRLSRGGPNQERVEVLHRPAFRTLRWSQTVPVRLVANQVVEIEAPGGPLRADDHLGWLLALPGAAALTLLVVAGGVRAGLTGDGWWKPGAAASMAAFARLAPVRIVAAAGVALMAAGFLDGAWTILAP